MVRDLSHLLHGLIFDEHYPNMLELHAKKGKGDKLMTATLDNCLQDRAFVPITFFSGIIALQLLLKGNPHQYAVHKFLSHQERASHLLQFVSATSIARTSRRSSPIDVLLQENMESPILPSFSKGCADYLVQSWPS